MMILQIILLLVLLFALFVLFLQNRFFFDFYSRNMWKVRWENILFKYSFGTDGSNFEFFLKFKKRKNLVSEEKDEKIREINEKTVEKTYIIPPEHSETERKTKKKPIKDTVDAQVKPQRRREPPQELEDTAFADENENKTGENWLSLAEKIWENEEKTVRALLKFIAKVIKLSFVMLTPAKIEINLFGGASDPAQTGWLYSAFIVFNSFFENDKRISLSFSPDFMHTDGWKCDAHIMYCFSIARIIVFVLAVIFSFPYICAAKCLHRNRKYIWKGKNGGRR
jgi:hypothetical protein